MTSGNKEDRALHHSDSEPNFPHQLVKTVVPDAGIVTDQETDIKPENRERLMKGFINPAAFFDICFSQHTISRRDQTIEPIDHLHFPEGYQG